MTDLLGASGDRIALSFGGRSAGSDELARAVAGAELPAGEGPVGCRADVDPVTVITTVLACLDRGRAVLVGGSQSDADRLADDLPAGTALALTTSGSTSADGSPRVVARTLESWLASAGPL
ncbi:hypothetical protein ESO86_10840, partial [Agromyces binzhouensis]